MRNHSMLIVAVLVIACAGLIAQSQLAQLGLTEAQAREFVLNEIKSRAPGRGANIAVGTRGFLALPPSARGAAARAAAETWLKEIA